MSVDPRMHWIKSGNVGGRLGLYQLACTEKPEFGTMLRDESYSLGGTIGTFAIERVTCSDCKAVIHVELTGGR